VTRVLATARPVRDLPAQVFVCRRCGIQRKRKTDRLGTRLCRDCQDVLRLDATRHWRELGMLCDGDECDGVARRGGLCGPCSDRARRAS